jgi:WD40 repeat protein
MSRSVALGLLLLLGPAVLAAPPEGALYQLGVPRLRHAEGGVICCAFSPDGKVLASVGNDDLGKLWDVATGKLLVELKGHTAGVQGCAFTPDGKQLLTGALDTTLKLWDVATGKEMRTFSGHTAAVLPVAVSPDGKLAASEGQDAVVRIWELATGKEVRTVPGHESQGTTNVAFSPDSKHLVTVSGEDYSLVLWETATGKEVRKFKGHQADVNSLEFSADGKRLISASSDKTVKLWTVATGQVERTFTGHADMVSTARFCPDGKTMLSGSVDHTLRLWDLATGKELRRFFGHRKTVSEVSVSPDGKIAATAGHDGTLRLWDITTGLELPQSAGFDAAAVSPDGKVLATGGGNWVRFWDAATGKPLPPKLDQQTTVVLLAYADNNTLAVLGDDDKVKLWDLTAGKVQRELTARRQPAMQPMQRRTPLHSLGVSADGKLVVVAGVGEATTWDGGSGKNLERPFQNAESRREGTLISLALSRDGRRVATINDEGERSTVRLWDAVRGQELRSFVIPSAISGDLTLSPDGRSLVTTAGQPTVRLWETATGLERARLPQPDELATAAVISPDGRLIAAADVGTDRTIHIYDIIQGKELAKFTGHTESVKTLTFLPESKALVSVGDDGLVMTWDLTLALKKLTPLRAKLEAKELEAAWSDLAGDDGVKAYAAVWTLAGAPEQALPLFRERLLKAEGSADVKKIPQWIKDLDSEEFVVREKATKELERLGRLAEPALREALEKPASLEVKLRAERILERLKQGGGTPDELRAVRAVEAVEKIGGAEARKLLEELAAGPSEAVATREAKAALERK